MAIPHKNYYPPADSVEVAGDRSWRWDGGKWLHNGRQDVPTNRRLQGKAGTSMAGWTYDWPSYSWMEPGATTTTPVVHSYPPMGAPAVQAPAMPTTDTAGQPLYVIQGGMNTMDFCNPQQIQKQGFWGALAAHPWAPGLGAIIKLGAEFMTQPIPPQLSQDMPDSLREQWQMIYARNINSFDNRKSLLNTLGDLLLAGGVANAAVAASNNTAVPALQTIAQTTAQTQAVQAATTPMVTTAPAMVAQPGVQVGTTAAGSIASGGGRVTVAAPAGVRVSR